MHRSTLRFGRFELRLHRRELWRDGRLCPLGGRAFDLLLLLLQEHERVLGCDELLKRVWPGLVVEPNNLQVQVWALRRLLGPGQIITVPRRGYRYVGPRPVALPPLGHQGPRSRVADGAPGGPAAALGPAFPQGVGETARQRLRWQAR